MCAPTQPSVTHTQQVVQQEAFLMKRALDSKNLREALKHSAVMISELRTPVPPGRPF